MKNRSYCPNARVVKWKVEWDTVPTFDSKGTKPLSYDEQAGTSPEVYDKFDGEGRTGTGNYPGPGGEYGTGFYNITGLEMGVRYYVRVSAFNSLGYGEPADYLDAVPCVSPDAPGLPTTMARLATDAGFSTQQQGTSLVVRWQAPYASDKYGDRNGDGGNQVTKYGVEWSHRPFTAYNQSIQTIDIRCVNDLAGAPDYTSGEAYQGRLTGEIRLGLNSTDSANFLERSYHESTNIEMSSDAWAMKRIIENMVNIGSVDVVTSALNVSNRTWTITFTSEMGPVPDLKVVATDLVCKGGGPATVTVTNEQNGAIPADARYLHKDVPVSQGDGSSFETVIPELTPGEKYYARVSAYNRLGYGARRDISPQGLGAQPDGGVEVPYQVPDAPLSPYYEGGSPTLELYGATELAVHCGAPAYSGGSELTKFVIEHDTKATFNSGESGGPLGSATLDASTTICDACITRFDLETNTLLVDGTHPHMMGALYKGATILVHKRWFFTVDANPSFSSVLVEPGHAVFKGFNLDNQTDRSGYPDVPDLLHYHGRGYSLDLLGRHHVIRQLTPGLAYYARCFAQNQAKGWGPPATTFPRMLVPRVAPEPPADVRTSVVDGNTLNVAWTASVAAGDYVRQYRIESYTADPAVSLSGSLFGVAEVQVVTTTGGPHGSFTLSFGALDRPLPGSLMVQEGESIVQTSTDLSGYVRRGDRIQIGGEVYLVHAQLDLNATHFYLSQTVNSSIPTNLGVYNLTNGYVGKSSKSIKAYVAQTTGQMPYDVSHVEMEQALEVSSDLMHEAHPSLSLHPTPLHPTSPHSVSRDHPYPPLSLSRRTCRRCPRAA